MPSTPDKLTDEDLMRMMCSATDRRAIDLVFQEVFERYHSRVVAWCYRIAKNRDTSNDLAQEVFLKAFRHRHSFRGDARLSTWLFAVTRNHCLTSLRKPQPESMPFISVADVALRDKTCVAPDHAAERNEMAGLLLGLMSRILEPMEVRVMTLHYAHEIPLTDITRVLGLHNPSGAKAYIVNARRKLLGLLKRRGWNACIAGEAPTADFWRHNAAA